MPEGNAGLGQIVRGHFDVDFVTYTDADEVLAHFARDMRKHLVPIGQSDPEHRPREDLRDRTRQFNWFFLHHSNWSL